MKEPPEFFIYGQVDRPCNRLIVVKYDATRCAYLHLGRELAFDPVQCIPLHKFGRTLLCTPADEGEAAYYWTEEIGPSTAMYNDGRPRDWQGSTLQGEDVWTCYPSLVNLLLYGEHR